MNTQAQTESLFFEAEVKQLLHLVTHSLYSNREIFLRELISNASDAADRMRYEALSDAALYGDDAELKIWVFWDRDTKTITIRDNGIGMTRDEVIKNLGTIARSGTREFIENIKEKSSSNAIGQFGVGFYSSFVVANEVEVRTRRAGMEAHQGVHWKSNGEGQFEISNIEKAMRGTEIILHLKEDAEEFLENYRLKEIIRKYSDHIVFPIVMEKKTENENKETIIEYEQINRANALWTLSKNEITDAQYIELYRHISHDFEDPLAWTHNRVEGKLEYTMLLYLPKNAPFDLWDRRVPRGLKLYVKRVFIKDDAEQLLPLYLRFVKGVVDSNDLPLNVSREILQSNKIIEHMKSGCLKRILSLLEDLSEKEPEKYTTFWNNFGQVLKEGPAEDYANRERIAKLIRFSTTKSTDQQTVSFQDYVDRMKDHQEKIYYVTADTYLSAKKSPLLEVFEKKDIEVILFFDKIDEWFVSNLTEYNGKSLQSIAKGELDLGALDDAPTQEEKKQQEEEFDDAIQKIKKILSDQVKEVRLTNRLVDSPACVVFDAHDLSGHMQRILASAGQTAQAAQPILELNPKHPLINHIRSETNEQRIERWAHVILGQALLSEGASLQDPMHFVRECNALFLEAALMRT